MVLCPQKQKEKERPKSGPIENGKDNCKQCVKHRKEKTSPKHTKSHPIPTSNSSHMLTSPAGSYQASSQPGTPMSPMGGPMGKFLINQPSIELDHLVSIHKSRPTTNQSIDLLINQMPSLTTWWLFASHVLLPINQVLSLTTWWLFTRHI